MSDSIPASDDARSAQSLHDHRDDDAPDVMPDDVRDLAEIPAIEVITRAAVMLMSSAAEKLGLAEDGEQHLDLDEARRLIHALAGLFDAAQSDLGIHRAPLRDGLQGLKAAFREASAIPDAPGQGPGESLRTPPPL